MICLLGNWRTNLISLQCTDAAEAEANHALFTARTINSDTKKYISNSFLLNIILLGKCWKGCEEEKGLLTSSESPHLNFLLKASPINNSNKKTNSSWNLIKMSFPSLGRTSPVFLDSVNRFAVVRKEKKLLRRTRINGRSFVWCAYVISFALVFITL